MKRNIDIIIERLPRLVAKQATYEEERSTATHEASHAMIILLNNEAPDKVTTNPPMTRYSWGRISTRFAVMLHMAGAAGNGIECGSYIWSKGDRENLDKTIRKKALEYPEIEILWKETHAALINNWHIVELITSKLMREGELKREYFQTLLQW